MMHLSTKDELILRQQKKANQYLCRAVETPLKKSWHWRPHYQIIKQLLPILRQSMQLFAGTWHFGTMVKRLWGYSLYMLSFIQSTHNVGGVGGDRGDKAIKMTLSLLQLWFLHVNWSNKKVITKSVRS